MSLYTEWEAITGKEMTPAESKVFWEKYFLKEKEVYESILENKTFEIKMSFKEFAEKYALTLTSAVGFIDGINTSLEKEIDIESLEEDTEINLMINKEKLYYNMHVAGAEWLYGLSQWDDNLSVERRAELEREYKASKTFVKEVKVGRNDPCVCGSGKKYKKCCG